MNLTRRFLVLMSLLSAFGFGVGYHRLAATFNPRTAQQAMAQTCSQLTHQRCTIDGSLSWHVLPWSGLTLNNVTLTPPTATHRPPTHVAQVDVAIDLLPLLVKRVRVSGLKLVRPDVMVQSEHHHLLSALTSLVQHLRHNVPSLDTSARTPMAYHFSVAPSLDLDVTDGRLVIQQPNEGWELKHLFFHANHWNMDSPFTMAMHGLWAPRSHRGWPFHVTTLASRSRDHWLFDNTRMVWSHPGSHRHGQIEANLVYFPTTQLLQAHDIQANVGPTMWQGSLTLNAPLQPGMRLERAELNLLPTTLDSAFPQPMLQPLWQALPEPHTLHAKVHLAPSTLEVITNFQQAQWSTHCTRDGRRAMDCTTDLPHLHLRHVPKWLVWPSPPATAAPSSHFLQPASNRHVPPLKDAAPHPTHTLTSLIPLERSLLALQSWTLNIHRLDFGNQPPWHGAQLRYVHEQGAHRLTLKVQAPVDLDMTLVSHRSAHQNHTTWSSVGRFHGATAHLWQLLNGSPPDHVPGHVTTDWNLHGERSTHGYPWKQLQGTQHLRLEGARWDATPILRALQEMQSKHRASTAPNASPDLHVGQALLTSHWVGDQWHWDRLDAQGQGWQAHAKGLLDLSRRELAGTLHVKHPSWLKQGPGVFLILGSVRHPHALPVLNEAWLHPTAHRR